MSPRPPTGSIRSRRAKPTGRLHSRPNYFEPGRDLVAKFGVNKARFFVRPGLQLRHIVFNNARPLFRDNVRLRKAVNFALNRRELARAATTAPLAYRLTDQYLPPSLPGYRDAELYPLERPNLARAKALARGNLRGGKAALYVTNSSPTIGCRADREATAGRDRARRRVEAPPQRVRLSSRRSRTPGEPWDIAIGLWQPDYVDPFQYVNLLFDPQYARRRQHRAIRLPPRTPPACGDAGRLQGPERYRAYGDLDVDLARDALPSAPISFFNEPTLVSEPGRLHRASSDARPDRRLPEVAARLRRLHGDPEEPSLTTRCRSGRFRSRSCRPRCSSRVDP